MNFNDRIKELKPIDLNCNIFDVYNYNGLSMQELLCQFFHKINDCIKISNDTIDLASWLVNEGLSIEVVNKLTLWLEDGTLENLINVNLFNSLNTKIDNLNSQLNTEIDNLNSQLNTEIDNLNSQLEHVKTQSFINIKDFGAIGDGETDNTQIFNNAIKYAIENEKPLYIPYGTYIISPLENINISGKSFIMYGDGKNTVIKRKYSDNYNKWSMLFNIYADSKSCKFVKISDLSVDNECRRYTIPDGENEFFYSRCSSFEIFGLNGYYIYDVDLKNLYFDNALASNIHFPGDKSCYVKNININNVHCKGRTDISRFADILITGGCESAIINNFVGEVLEVELNSRYNSDTPMKIHVSDSVIYEVLDLIGENMDINVCNVDTNRFYVGSATNGHISNCIIRQTNGIQLPGSSKKKLFFNNCVFHYKVTNNVSTPLSFIYGDYSVYFDSCKFILDSEEQVDCCAIEMATNISSPKYLYLNNCIFDKGFKNNILADRTGYVNLNNNTYSGWDCAIRILGSSSVRGTECVINGGCFNNAEKLFNIESATDVKLYLRNITLDYLKTDMSKWVLNYKEAKIKENNRLLFTDTTPTYGLVGDIVRLRTPITGNAYEWLCIESDKVNARWVVTKTL